MTSIEEVIAFLRSLGDCHPGLGIFYNAASVLEEFVEETQAEIERLKDKLGEP